MKRFRRTGAVVALLAWVGLALLPSQGNAGDATDTLSSMLEAANWPAERLEEIGPSATSPTQERDLLKLALRLKRFDSLLGAAAAEPEGLALTLRGTASAIERIPLDERSATLLGIPAYFRIQVTPPQDGTPQTVLVPEVPKAWLRMDSLNQPVELNGVLVGATLVAPSVAWRPDTISDHVNFGQIVLGRLGFDVARLDSAIDSQPLLAQENELFYELLTSVRETGANQLARFAQGNLERYARAWRENSQGDILSKVVLQRAEQGFYSVAPLFNQQPSPRGELFVFEGAVRRVVRVAVDEAASERFDLDHYYELEMFPRDSQNLPLVFCVLELPAGFPVGDKVNQHARLAGFFMKRWAYRTRKPTLGAPRSHDKTQLAPLLIGRAPIPLAAPETSGAFGEVIAGGVFVLVLGGIWWMIWRSSRSDHEFEMKFRAKLQGGSPSDLSDVSEQGP